MPKNKILIFLLIFTMSCGYEPIHSKKNRLMNSYFSISEVNYTGDRDVNIKIKELLKYYTLSKNTKNYNIRINSESLKIIIAKDSNSNPTTHELKLKVTALVIKEGEINKEFIFEEKFKYNNIEDKYELKKYEKELKRNLTKVIIDNLLNNLLNYK